MHTFVLQPRHLIKANGCASYVDFYFPTNQVGIRREPNVMRSHGYWILNQSKHICEVVTRPANKTNHPIT